MAIDGKYGRVTLESGTIGEAEPVVVFRAQDAILPQLLEHYRDLCSDAGSPEHHLASIGQRIADIRSWQADHHTQVPRSDALRPE